jgi:hypothetical protein
MYDIGVLRIPCIEMDAGPAPEGVIDEEDAR